MAYNIALVAALIYVIGGLQVVNRLTITDHIDIIVVVAVVNAPAWEATLCYVGLIAPTADSGEPHHSRPISIC